MIEELVRRWVERAEKDLKIARRELKSDEPIYEEVLFHCQQAVEKYLKAFLTKHQVFFKKTHDISYLIALCMRVDKEFKHLYSIEADKLYPRGIDVRYPEIELEVTEEEAREALEIAEKVRDFVLKKLGTIGISGE